MEELRYWAIGLVVLGAVAVVGCGTGDTSTAGGGTGGTSGTGGTGGTGGSGGSGGGIVCPDDPAAGAVPEACGIWVSVSQGDDANDGRQATPVKTLTHAIELAQTDKNRVYACGETWTESLVVTSGLSLHGGFDCDAGWTYEGEIKRAMIIAPSPRGVTWIGIGEPTRGFFTDFYVESADAVEPGDSSIAGFVRESLLLTALRCEFTAGNGADGVDGDPADVNGLPALSGTPGNDGANACSAPLSQGGAAVEIECFPGLSKGGKGGDSGPLIAASGEAGEPVAAGGSGGLGQDVAPACTPGSSGAKGSNGPAGQGGGQDLSLGYGRLLQQGFVGQSGEDGGLGAPAQGGGGGGATFGSAAVCGAANPGGAAGGSGGAGGCAGKGSGGGRPGGGSFAFATRSDGGVVLDMIYFRSGKGGKGGNGGAPQLGGAGGAGGKGGNSAGSIEPGCAGGNGATGGRGGIGGGGMGGPSAAWVQLKGTLVFGPMWTGFEIGTGGEGGIGDPNFQDTEGAEGPESLGMLADQ